MTTARYTTVSEDGELPCEPEQVIDTEMWSEIEWEEETDTKERVQKLGVWWAER